MTKLPNIGEVLEKELAGIGITSPEELRRQGAKQAFLQIRALYKDACLSKLQALEGAVRGVRWHALPPDVKADLKGFYAELS